MQSLVTQYYYYLVDNPTISTHLLYLFLRIRLHLARKLGWLARDIELYDALFAIVCIFQIVRPKNNARFD